MKKLLLIIAFLLPFVLSQAQHKDSEHVLPKKETVFQSIGNLFQDIGQSIRQLFAKNTRANITYMEYFIDTDPGYENGTEITFTEATSGEISFTADLSSLTNGVHTLFVRIKDANNDWSTTFARNFMVWNLPTDAAPNMVKAEYFIDEDPGYGLGTDVPVTAATAQDVSFTADLSGVSNGYHELFFRTQNANGHWSQTVMKPFMVGLTIADVDYIEYFIDADPGYENGTAVEFDPFSRLEVSFNVDLDTVSTGVHTLFVRSRTTSGNWSQTFMRTFMKWKLATENPAAIVKAEYFFNSDPGYGNGTNIPLVYNENGISFTADLTTLDNGVHNLFIRTMDGDSMWSQTFMRQFIKSKIQNDTLDSIVQAEYFIDEDPGYGLAQAIGLSADSSSIQQDFVADISAYNEGMHTLFIRAKDAAGYWSVVYMQDFEICNPPAKPDTPVGASSLCLNPENTQYKIDSVEFATSYNWELLPASAGEIIGNDTIAQVNWSDDFIGEAKLIVQGEKACQNGPYSDTLFVEVFGYPEITISNDTAICVGDSTLLAVSGGTGYLWSTGNTLDSLYFSPMADSKVYVTVSENGCSVIDSVQITVNPLPEISLGNDTALCESETLLLNPGTFAGYLWSNNSEESTLTVTEAGEYWLAVSDENSCTSADTILVTYNLIDSIFIDTAICEGNSFMGYTESGEYLITETSILTGCDSVIQLTLNVNPLPTVDLGNDTALCESETLLLNPGAFASYLWSNASTENTLTVSEAGEYWLEVTNENSCSNSDTIWVAYNLIDSVFIDTTICEGNSFMGFDQNGEYFVTETSLLTGCDSIIHLQLTVNNVDTTVQNGAICDGESFEFYGSQLTTAGTYYQTLTSSLNCDSVIQLQLMVNPVYSFSETQAICQGETLSWHGEDYAEAGTYFANYTTSNGCDSIFELELSVNYLPVVNLGPNDSIKTNESLVLDAGAGFESYLWNTDESTQSITVDGESLGIGEYEYWVWVTDANTCQNGDTVLITVTLADGITQSSALVKVYPNPVQDELTVEHPETIESIQLLNIDGKVLKQVDAINQKAVSISVDEWQQGSYLLRISTADKETQVIKIVKNN